MFKKIVIFSAWIGSTFFIATAFAGKVELTTYYPAPYGEYQALKATQGMRAGKGDTAYGDTTNHGYAFGIDGDTGMFATLGASDGAQGSNLYFNIDGQTRMRVLNNGNVGIRTNNPLAALHVAKAGTGILATAGSSGNGWVELWPDATSGGVGPAIVSASYRSDPPYQYTGQLRFGFMFAPNDTTGYIEGMKLSLNNVLTGPSTLTVNGDLVVTGNATVGGHALTAGATWWQVSDIKIKTDVEKIQGEAALEVIEGLRPVKFRFTEEYLSQHPETQNIDYYNFIAQEFQNVWPDSVKEDQNGLLSINTSNTIPFLVSAIQELAKEIKDLKTKNMKLEEEVETIQKRK